MEQVKMKSSNFPKLQVVKYSINLLSEMSAGAAFAALYQSLLHTFQVSSPLLSQEILTLYHHTHNHAQAQTHASNLHKLSRDPSSPSSVSSFGNKASFQGHHTTHKKPAEHFAQANDLRNRSQPFTVTKDSDVLLNKISILQRQLENDIVLINTHSKSRLQQTSKKSNNYRHTSLRSQRPSLDQSLIHSHSKDKKTVWQPRIQKSTVKRMKTEEDLLRTPTVDRIAKKSMYLEQFKCKVEEEIKNINHVLKGLDSCTPHNNSSKTIQINLSKCSLTLSKKRNIPNRNENNQYYQECSRVSIKSRSLEKSFVDIPRFSQPSSCEKSLRGGPSFGEGRTRTLLTTKIARGY